MNVIYRNLYRLINTGAFNDKQDIEPMTNWKWKKIFEISKTQSIASIVYDGLEQYIKEGALTLPAEQMEKWENSVNSLEKSNMNIKDKYGTRTPTIKTHPAEGTKSGQHLSQPATP